MNVGCCCGRWKWVRPYFLKGFYAMPAWFKRRILNLWRRPFRTVLVVVFLALVVGLFTVMATVNRLA